MHDVTYDVTSRVEIFVLRHYPNHCILLKSHFLIFISGSSCFWCFWNNLQHDYFCNMQRMCWDSLLNHCTILAVHFLHLISVPKYWVYHRNDISISRITSRGVVYRDCTWHCRHLLPIPLIRSGSNAWTDSHESDHPVSDCHRMGCTGLSHRGHAARYIAINSWQFDGPFIWYFLFCMTEFSTWESGFWRDFLVQDNLQVVLSPFRWHELNFW